MHMDFMIKSIFYLVPSLANEKIIIKTCSENKEQKSEDLWNRINGDLKNKLAFKTDLIQGFFTFSHPTARQKAQITTVRIESRTILVVADWVLVTDKPKKLKKAIEITFSKTAIMIIGLFPICVEFHKKYIQKSLLTFSSFRVIAIKMA